MSEQLPQPASPRSYPAIVSDPFDPSLVYQRSAAERKDISMVTILSVLARRWFYLLAGLLVGASVAWFMASRQTPIYSASATMRVNINPAPSADVFDLMSGRSETRTIETQMAIINLPLIQSEAIAQSGVGPEDMEGFSTSVEQIKDTNLVSIRVESAKPDVARKVANSIAAVYLRRSRQNNQSEIANTRRFLEVQLSEKRDELARKQKQLEREKRRLGGLDIEQQVARLSTALNSLETEYRDARVKRLAANDEYREVEKQLMGKERSVVSSVTTSVNPIVSQLQAQLASLETDRAAALQEFLPNQPEVVLIEGKINDIRERLRNETQQTIVAAQQEVPNPARQELLQQATQLKIASANSAARERALGKSLRDTRGRVQQLPSAERILTSLSNDVSQLTDHYRQLNQRYQTIRIDEQAKLSDGQLMQPASLPRFPIRPEKDRMVFAGSFLGLFLALIIVLVREGLDSSLREPREIEKSLGLPILAGIPNIDSLVGRMIPWGKDRLFDDPALHEGARLVQMGMTYNARPDADIRSIMVTSPLANQGKTTITHQLGRVMARSGKRVVLIDADYRRAGLSLRFSASRKPGMTTLLDRPQDLESLLLATDTPGLFLLPTGPLPHDPVDMMQTDVYADLVDRLKKSFDIVLFDASPLMISDGFFLSRYVDGVILVVVPSRTPQVTIERCVDLLHRMQVKILGICLNKVGRFDTNSYHDHYRYGYYAGSYYSRNDKRSVLMAASREAAPAANTVSSNGKSPE